MTTDVRSSFGREQWERISALFERAVELTPAERDVWLQSRSGADASLVETVRRMLAADDAPRELLDRGIAPAAHLVLEPEATLPPGTRVGAFDVVGELGRGGMGTVYAAKDRHLDRPVALKFLQLRPGSQRDAADRLIAEAKAASALDHPNVATIYQIASTDDGRSFIAMPRLRGKPVRGDAAADERPRRIRLHVASAARAGTAPSCSSSTGLSK